MPAVLIRQLENFQKIMAVVATPGDRELLLRHARMVLQASEESVTEPSDRNDVRSAYDTLVGMAEELWDG
jgi:hypothetical protein